MNKLVVYISFFLSLQFVFASNTMFLDPINISVLNTDKDEFAPSWNKFTNTLYFTSNKSGEEKLYTSNKDADGFFKSPIYLDNPINSAHKNISYIDFLSEEKAYFSTFYQFKDQPQLQLFYSNYKKQAWSEGFPISDLASDKFVGQCSVSPDNNQIVFTMQSRDGDLDLMVSYRMEDGTWRTPIPIDILNTTSDEITPHFASDDTLYFASNGQGGPGGYDIFFSVKSEGIWQRPSPMFELNTEYDESDAITLPNGDLMFASNRPGGKGGLDLWLASNNRVALALRQEASLDIQLQSYINNIVIYDNYEYSNLPITSIFYLQDSTMELQPKIFEYHSINELQKSLTVEDSYFNSLNYIGAMLSKTKTDKLKITASYPGQLEIDSTVIKNSKYYADRNIKKISDFLTEKYNIAPSQIVYNYEFYQEEGRKPSISFSSNNQELFSQLEIRKDSIELEQKILPIDIKIEPAINLSHWLASIEFAGKRLTVFENTTSKERISLNLEKYKNLLFDTDNLKVIITAYSQNRDSVYKVIPHNIEHHNSKKPKLVQIGNMSYDLIYLFATNDSNIESQSYKSNLERIFNSMTMCKSIEISYNGNLKLAESLKNKLQSKIINNQVLVKLVKETNRINNSLLDENLIIVKIGKYTFKSSNN